MTPKESFVTRLDKRHALQPMYTSVSLQRIEGFQMKTVGGHAYDISLGGMRIETDAVLSIGERVAVCVRLPGERVSIFASGRVVWVNDEDDDPAGRRAAMQFIRFLSEEDLERLKQYLSRPAQSAAAA